MNHSDHSVLPHHQAWDLIPWVVNGRASVEEKRIVDDHLAICGHCRDELASQLQTYRAIKLEDDVTVDPQAGLQRLWARIDQHDSPSHDFDFAPSSPPIDYRRRGRIGFWKRGLLAVAVLEAIGLAASCGALWLRPAVPSTPASYRTLTAQTEVVLHATIRAVLVPTMTMAELQDLLTQTHLQIVAGPSEAGVYSLAPLSLQANISSRRELAQLRANPGVRFAEPVDVAATAPLP